MRYLLLSFAAVASFGAAARAEVVQSSAAGFEVRQVVTVAAPIARVWTTLVAPRLWWDKDHTYSDDSANLSLDERAGGCFCEKLVNKGSVEHMRVVYIQPPQMIRMTGALGPLQAEAADGTMAITLAKDGAGTQVTLRYVAGGYIRAGADQLAPKVDEVLGVQLARLKAAAEAGAPGARPAVATPVSEPAPDAPTTPAPETPATDSATRRAEIEATLSGLDDSVVTAPETPPAAKPR